MHGDPYPLAGHQQRGDTRLVSMAVTGRRRAPAREQRVLGFCDTSRAHFQCRRELFFRLIRYEGSIAGINPGIHEIPRCELCDEQCYELPCTTCGIRTCKRCCPDRSDKCPCRYDNSPLIPRRRGVQYAGELISRTAVGPAMQTCGFVTLTGSPDLALRAQLGGGTA